MKITSLAVAISMIATGQKVLAAGFVDDSKASVSSRTLYYENDQRGVGGIDQRQTVTGLRFDLSSGYTQGVVGVGVDVLGLLGVDLGGGVSPHNANTVNTVTPVRSDGSPVSDWSRIGANANLKISKTELKTGNALAPNLPVLQSNDSRVLPASYQGAIVTSKDIDNITWTVGNLNREVGRASSNWAGIAAGGRKGSDSFRFGGADWALNKNLTLQYYHAELEDYYSQDFFGLLHAVQIESNQSFKTDLRYFNSRSAGKNGTDPNYAYRNGYNKGNAGEVDNTTWSAAFTYNLGGHALTLGHQRVSDSGGMAFVNNGSVVDGRGRLEGEGGSSIYLYTDIMINNFSRAGENSTFGIYSYDFVGLGFPGLKASATYISGRDIRGTGGVSTGRYAEWERDMRLDYVLQGGAFKGLGFSLRRANFRTSLPAATLQDQDQTRFFVSYTYALW